MGLFDEVIPGIGAGLSALTGTVGGIANMNAQDKANSDANDRSKWMLQQQTDLSNTAHQREVKDLQAAGLNPILSGTGGQGASTPSGTPSPVTAPEIHLPDFMAYGTSLRQLEQADQKLTIDKANSAATIAKSLSDQDVNRANVILSKQGLLGRELGTDMADKLKGITSKMIQNVKTPDIKNFFTAPWKNQPSSGGEIPTADTPNSSSLRMKNY